MSKLTLGQNLSSIRTQRFFADNDTRLQNSLRKISSGLRINSASDDAAGLSISMGLNARGRIYTQAVRNINDGISALSISEAALEQLTGITIRQKELASQAANESYSSIQRQALDEEASALTQEYNRIIATTKFNGINLFQDSPVALNIQTGIGDSASIGTTLGLELGSSSAESSSIDFSATLVTGIKESTTYAASSTFGYGEYTHLMIDSLGSTPISGDYFTFEHDDTEYYLWFNVDGAGGDPFQPGTGIEVNISSFDNASQWMDQVSTVLTSFSINHTRLTDGTSEFVTLNPTLLSDQTDTQYFSASGALFSYSGGFTPTYQHYFQIRAEDNELYYVYYQNDPMLAATGIHVELDVQDSAEEVALKTVSALQATGKFTGTTNGSGAFTITTAVAGNLTNSTLSAAGSGLTGPTINSGRLLQTNQNYFTFSTSSGDYYAWFQDGVSVDPALADRTGIAISAIGEVTPTQLAQLAKTYIDLALPSDGIITSVSGSALTINNTAVGEINDAVSYIAGVNFSIQQGSLASAEVTEIDLSSSAAARTAITELDERLDRISAENATQGSFASRLTTARSVIESTIQNYAAANSRIVSADIAEESAILIQASILKQAGAAVLAQANQGPDLLLSLLSY